MLTDARKGGPSVAAGASSAPSSSTGLRLAAPGRPDIKVCQRWSGHSRLSVFLDIYQGLIPGHEQNAAAQLNASLTAGAKPSQQPSA